MQIFISYKREDETFARQLSGQLQTWGYESWLDVECIPPGEDWDTAIHRGLQTSDMVLGVLTPKSVTSVNVLDEWGWALSNNKPLIPLKLEETPPAAIPPRYIRAQYIDFTKDQNAGYDRLKVRLTNPATLYQSPSGNGHATVSSAIDWEAEPNDNRGRMLKNVYDFWIKGVLDNVLRESQGFELGLDTAPGAVLQHRDYGNYVLPGSASIGQVFEDMNRELLILGVPGSGKTILLLQLARQLLERAWQDETFPMPVVFNLSSWAAGRKPLSEWLKNSLSLSYGVPKKVAEEWVEGEKLLLLLDGLDEVAEQHRDACLEAINQFKRRYHMVDVTVCSRIEEYAALTGKLDLQGAVTLRPLTEAQIQAYIAGDSLAGLRKTLQTDPALAEMAQSPFLLNCMATAYQGKSEIALKLPAGADSGSARRKHLFDTYIEHRLQHENYSKHAPTFIRQYLAWLAKRMTAHKQSMFHMEGLQLDWLQSGADKDIFNSIVVAIIILSGLSIFGIISLIVSKLSGLMGIGVGVGSISGMVLGLVVGLSGKVIHCVDVLIFDFKILLLVFIGGLSVGVAAGAIFGIDIGLGVTLVALLGIGLYIVMGNIIYTNEYINNRIQPNEGIRWSVWNTLRMGLGAGLLSTPFGFVAGGFEQPLCLSDNSACGVEYLRWTFGWSNWEFMLLVALLVILAVGLFYGGRPVIFHYTIRFLLWRRGSIPWNYAAFLDHAASLNILRKVGGGYIFIHRTLLEYFAELETE